MSKRKYPERENVKSLYKKKPRSESTPFDELSDLEKLPVEAIEQIIGNLRGNDVLNLTLVSKNLNSIITENSKLLEGIIFRFPTKAELAIGIASNEWYKNLGNRNYPNILFRGHSILTSNLTSSLAPLKNCAPFIKIIRFNYRYYGVTHTLLTKVLSLCYNIEELKINLLHRKYIDVKPEMAEIAYENGPKALSLQNLKVLELPAVTRTLDLFKDCRLKKLIINEEAGESNATLHKLRFQRFLQSQPDLTSLHFISLSERIFRDDEMSKMPFKLKELAVDYLNLYDENLPYFRSFVESQRDSLEILSLGSCNLSMYRPAPILDIFENFQNLKKLIITIGPNTQALPLMKQIENLEVRVRGGVNLPKSDGKFPNVKNLTIADLGIKIFTDESLKEMKQLERLTMKSCNFANKFSITAVKKLTLSKCHFTGNCQKNLNGVTELTITDCLAAHLTWLGSYLRQNNGILKKLKLCNVVAPAEVRVFLNYDHMIDHVIYDNVTFEAAA